MSFWIEERKYMKHYLSIVDKDREYAGKLADYLNAKEGFPFIVRTYDDTQLKENNISESDLILVDETLRLAINNLREKVIVLSASITEERNGIRYLSKYNDCESIAREILAYGSKMESLSIFVNRTTPLRVLSFYSPVKRCGQTTLAMNFAKELSKRSRTLYINMQGFSGLDERLGVSYTKDITDLLYNYENGAQNLSTVIGSIVESVDGLDIMPSVRGHEELINISYERWKSLIGLFERDSDYEYLILDLSDGVKGLEQIMEESEKVISITVDNSEEKAKYNEYIKLLEITGHEEIIKKTVKLSNEESRDICDIRKLMSDILAV